MHYGRVTNRPSGSAWAASAGGSGAAPHPPSASGFRRVACLGLPSSWLGTSTAGPWSQEDHGHVDRSWVTEAGPAHLLALWRWAWEAGQRGGQSGGPTRLRADVVRGPQSGVVGGRRRGSAGRVRDARAVACVWRRSRRVPMRAGKRGVARPSFPGPCRLVVAGTRRWRWRRPVSRCRDGGTARLSVTALGCKGDAPPSPLRERRTTTMIGAVPRIVAGGGQERGGNLGADTVDRPQRRRDVSGESS